MNTTTDNAQGLREAIAAKVAEWTAIEENGSNEVTRATLIGAACVLRGILATRPPQQERAAQPISTCPVNDLVLVWWPVVKLDDDYEITDEVLGGQWLISELDDAGIWSEPDEVGAMGHPFDDFEAFARAPTFWHPLPAAMIGRSGQPAAPAAPATPEQHPDDVAVDRFAVAMKAKLAAARAKGRGGWEDKSDCTQQDLSDMLRAHVEKGDPRDVANFCMFLHQRGEGIAPVATPESAEPVALQHMAVAENGVLRWMTGRKVANCELYAMPDWGTAPKLYTHPTPAASDGGLREALTALADDMLADSKDRGLTHGFRHASNVNEVKLRTILATPQASTPAAVAPEQVTDVEAEAMLSAIVGDSYSVREFLRSGEEEVIRAAGNALLALRGAQPDAGGLVVDEAVRRYDAMYDSGRSAGATHEQAHHAAIESALAAQQNGGGQ